MVQYSTYRTGRDFIGCDFPMRLLRGAKHMNYYCPLALLQISVDIQTSHQFLNIPKWDRHDWSCGFQTNKVDLISIREVLPHVWIDFVHDARL